MTRAIDDSKKVSYLLIEFLAHETYYRFTNWGTTLDPAGDNWRSMPSIDVKWPKNTGTLAPGGCIITGVADALPTFQTLVDLLLADGTPGPPVFVEIREVIKPTIAGDQATELVPFKGRVLRAVRNAGGRAKHVRFEVQSIKSRLDIPLGLPCNHHCPWSFMGRGCSVQGGSGARGPQLAVERKLVTIVGISGKQITLSADPNLTSPKSLRFGYVEKDGVRVGVQDWDPLDPTKIVLRQQPPASWLNAGATAVPGCDKTVETCRAAWSNEANFGGIGYVIPAYDPHFEDGA